MMFYQSKEDEITFTWQNCRVGQHRLKDVDGEPRAPNSIRFRSHSTRRHGYDPGVQADPQEVQKSEGAQVSKKGNKSTLSQSKNAQPMSTMLSPEMMKQMCSMFGGLGSHR
jgi:hypothetical protein